MATKNQERITILRQAIEDAKREGNWLAVSEKHYELQRRLEVEAKAQGIDLVVPPSADTTTSFAYMDELEARYNACRTPLERAAFAAKYSEAIASIEQRASAPKAMRVVDPVVDVERSHLRTIRSTYERLKKTNPMEASAFADRNSAAWDEPSDGGPKRAA